MTATRMAKTLLELHGRVQGHSHILADLLISFCEGAPFYNSDTVKLFEELISEMPEPDNFTMDDLVNAIRRVGTPFAVAVANDLDCKI